LDALVLTELLRVVCRVARVAACLAMFLLPSGGALSPWHPVR
jgi:hypothetical protein